MPQTALVEEMGNFFVFVKVCDEEYEKRLVTLGSTDGVRTEITSGLSAGETFLRVKQLSPVVPRWCVWRRIPQPSTLMPVMFIKCDMNVLMR